MLIEDDPADAFLVREFLADAAPGLTVDWYRDIDRARDRLTRPAYGVLVDLGLPSMSGLEALTTVRQAAPGAAVIVLTGLDDEGSGAAALAGGAQDYLVKGQVNGHVLARALRYAAERRRAEDTVRRLSESQLRERENARLERGLLPVPILTDPRVRHASRYRPGRQQAQLGGDFYDLIETSDGTLRAIIGDVSGHGPDEAAVGVSLRIAWRTLVLSGIAPAQVLSILQRVLECERRDEEMFATACTLLIAPDRASLEVRLAGHPPPLLLGSHVRAADGDVGPPLGVRPGDHWPSVDVPLGDVDSVLLFTDGLVEGRIGEGPQRLGIDGLVQMVAVQRERGPAPLPIPERLIATAEELHGGPLADDVAVLLVSWSN